MRDTRNTFLLIRFAILLFLARLQMSDGAKKHQVVVRFSRVVCRVYNDTLIQSLNCNLVRNDFTKELMLNADIRMTKSINSMILKNKFLVNRSGTITKFYDKELDVCGSLTLRFDFYLFRIVLEEMLRKSNIPLKCAFRENVLYYMHNFTLNSKYFPQFLPNLEWLSYMNFTFNNRMLFGMDVFGSVMRKKT